MGEVAPNGDGMAMNLPEIRAVLDELGKLGGDLKADWGGRQTQIGALERPLGNGPLGRSFARDYNTVVVDLTAAADKLLAAPERHASTGEQCLGAYDEAGAAADRAFQV
ncbi:hypothetical protein [Phytohabitans rumicis]|uniref:hypothetical protein n=1 Tax=Phytohabitans rumicis TaxID=1076125 RepID=UPI0031E8216D